MGCWLKPGGGIPGGGGPGGGGPGGGGMTVCEWGAVKVTVVVTGGGGGPTGEDRFPCGMPCW